MGVRDLLDALPAFLPAATGSADRPVHASIFKMEMDAGGHPVAYARLHDGRLSSRDAVTRHRRLPDGTVTVVDTRATQVSTFTLGATRADVPAVAGDIATVVGLTQVEIGDQLGAWDASYGGRLFAAPGLESVVLARDPADRGRLFAALQQLAAQDPLIDARLDGPDDELTVNLYGEVQREVLTARLVEEFGVDAEFLPARTAYVERILGRGTSSAKVPSGNASVTVRVEAGTPGSGGRYRMGTERGYLLPSFHHAVEETVPAVLTRGLRGWRVVDWVVTLTDARFSAPTPPAGYYRELTTRTLGEALERAGTYVCEPVSTFEIEAPADAVSQVLQLLLAARGTPDQPGFGGRRCRITGRIPADQVHGLERRLPELTQGQGFIVAQPDGYEPVVGAQPTRR